MSKQKHIHISLLLFSTGFFIMASTFFTFSFQKKMDSHTIESSFLFREQLSLEEKQYLQTHIAVKATQMEKMKQAPREQNVLSLAQEMNHKEARYWEQKAAEEAQLQAEREAVTAAKIAEEATLAAVPAPVAKETKPAAQGNKQLVGSFVSTAYAIGDGLTPSTVTANGTDVSNTIYSPEGYRIIAVDTNIIPLNSVLEVHIPGQPPFYAKACDTGSAINGYKIDLLVGSVQEALVYGYQNGISIYYVG